MNIAQYILNDVTPLSINDSVKEAQLVFNQLTFSHIPITEKGIYVGCLSETDAHCFDAEKTINDSRYALEQFFVRKHTNWIDVLEAFAQNSANIMPILNDKNDYIGYYELNDIISVFNESFVFSNMYISCRYVICLSINLSYIVMYGEITALPLILPYFRL